MAFQGELLPKLRLLEGAQQILYVFVANARRLLDMYHLICGKPQAPLKAASTSCILVHTHPDSATTVWPFGATSGA